MLLFVLSMGPTFWCTTEQAVQAIKWRVEAGATVLHEADSASTDRELAGDKIMRTASRLNDSQTPTHLIADLNETQQQDVVDDRADGGVRHETRYTENFWILIKNERRDEAALGKGNQTVHEFPENALIAKSILVRCQTIEHEPLNLMFFNYLFDPMIVSVDFELERRIMQILHRSGRKLFAKIQPECVGIALNLQRMLVERNQKVPGDRSCHFLRQPDNQEATFPRPTLR